MTAFVDAFGVTDRRGAVAGDLGELGSESWEPDDSTIAAMSVGEAWALLGRVEALADRLTERVRIPFEASEPLRCPVRSKSTRRR